MSQSTFLLEHADLVEDVLHEISDALATRASMAAPRREAVARTVRAMLLGLCPENVMQLMLAGQAVLFHALTMDAVREAPHDEAGTLNVRAHTIPINLSQTVTRNLTMLIRSRGGSAKPSSPNSLTPPDIPIEAEDQGWDAAARIEAEAMLSRLLTEEAACGTDDQAAQYQSLNREQRRRAERERVRLSRRRPTATNECSP